MKAKLVKTENGYGLEDVEIIAFYSSKRPEHKHYKLSKQNCDEIFGVVDVEKLANDSFYKKFCKDSMQIGLYDVGFEDGFNKAIELNKDKKFTEENIEEAFAYGQLNQVHNQKYFSGSKTYIQSLQQPAEIEVVIVTESMNIDEIRKQGQGFLNANLNKPKLDENGRLILKKI
jgi:hypothetical protein